MDLIYEHDFLVHVVETKAKLLSPSQSNQQQQPAVDLSCSSPVQRDSRDSPSTSVVSCSPSDEVECVDGMMETPRALLRKDVNALLALRMTPKDVRVLIASDSDVHEAAKYWTRKGVRICTGGKVKQYEAWESKPQTEGKSHKVLYASKKLMHEMSAEAALERVFRSWEDKNVVEEHDNDDCGAGNSENALGGSSADAETFGSVSDCLAVLGGSKDGSKNKESKKKLKVGRVLAKNAGHLVASTVGCPEIVQPLLSSYLSSVEKQMEQKKRPGRSVTRLKQVSKKMRNEGSAKKQKRLEVVAENRQDCNVEEPSDPDSEKQSRPIIPMRRLDPFYHQAQRSSESAVATSVSKLVSLKDRLMKSGDLKGAPETAKIFASLIARPPISLGATRILQSSELLEELRELYLRDKNKVQLKFLPVLKFLFNTSKNTRNAARSAAVREVSGCCLILFILGNGKVVF